MMNFVTALLALAALPFTNARAAERQPNIVIILADDLGYGDVQLLNPSRGKIPTPHLDLLAAQGMIFTDAHSGSSVCTPTRYGLLTGRYAWRSRLQRGVLDGGSDAPLIAAERLTVGEMLRGQGYKTACVGKWHLGFEFEKAADGTGKKAKGRSGAPVGTRITGGPVTRGFDEFWGCSNARTMESLIEGDRVIESLPPVEMLPRLTRRAEEFIATNAKAPFFLYVALTSPHTPIVPAPGWKGNSPLGEYADFVMQTDAAVGHILAALEQHGIADKTLVIFTADNGCSPQADVGALEKKGHFASAGFRGYKSDIWEGGHRVPFFVRWPGVVKPGSTSDATICLVDFMATAAEITGVKLPADAAPDSVSFLPMLRGTSTAPQRDSVVHHSIDGKFAIRSGQWKLCLCAGSGGWSKGGDSAPVQLYDLTADPAESTNLAPKNPEIVARLTLLLHRQITEGRSTPGPKQSNDTKVQLP
jgi:arylsulfatase A-like enzyme